MSEQETEVGANATNVTKVNFEDPHAWVTTEEYNTRFAGTDHTITSGEVRTLRAPTHNDIAPVDTGSSEDAQPTEPLHARSASIIRAPFGDEWVLETKRSQSRSRIPTLVFDDAYVKQTLGRIAEASRAVNNNEHIDDSKLIRAVTIMQTIDSQDTTTTDKIHDAMHDKLMADGIISATSTNFDVRLYTTILAFTAAELIAKQEAFSKKPASDVLGAFLRTLDSLALSKEQQSQQAQI